MKLKILSAAAATFGAALAFSAGAQSTPSTGPGAATGGMSSPDSMSGTNGTSDVIKMDKNKDGMISKAEATTDKDLTKRWKELDANGDNMIDSSEMVALNSGAGSGSGTRGPSGSMGSSGQKNPQSGTSTVPSTGEPSLDTPTSTY